MFNIDLAIKFGASEIIVFRKGLGIVAKEPAYLAVEKVGKHLKVKSAGKDAERLYYSKTGDIFVEMPIENGTIKNEKYATLLMQKILANVLTDKKIYNTINAIVAVPCGMEPSMLRALKRVLYTSGVTKITFVQNAVCARANCSFDKEICAMFVDIGKSVTDVAVASDLNFVFGRTYCIGGQDMNSSLLTYINDNYNLAVADETCEEIKTDIASLYSNDRNKAKFYGLSEDEKFVKAEIFATDVKYAIGCIYDKIFELVKRCLKELKPEIRTQIQKTGIIFTGGACEISGFYEYAENKFDYPITVLEYPSDAVIKGAGKLLNKNKDYLKIEF